MQLAGCGPTGQIKLLSQRVDHDCAKCASEEVKGRVAKAPRGGEHLEVHLTRLSSDNPTNYRGFSNYHHNTAS